MKHWLSIILVASWIFGTIAQELNCEVTVNAQQIQLSDKSVFKNLENAVREFMNSRKWTEDEFKPHERIDCSILINVSAYNQGAHTFKASATIQSSRPVFNSNYNTVLLNHIDEDFSFTYQEFEPLVFNENSFQSNLTSLLAFYAYTIIGIDYDSFSEKGGTPFFEQAQTIVNNAQNADFKGWSPSDTKRKNRYWLVENYLNPTFEPLRKVYYKYHRKGLDVMHKDTEAGRETILECLNNLVDLNAQKPQSLVLQIFFNSKSDELVGIFKEAKPNVKSKAVQLLTKMDATHTQEYRKILR